MSSRNPKRLSAPKLHEFHMMRLTGSPAKLVAVIYATDEKASLAEAIERYRAAHCAARRVTDWSSTGTGWEPTISICCPDIRGASCAISVVAAALSPRSSTPM
jgi:hypothetical protein